MGSRINESEMGVLIYLSKGNPVAKLVPGGTRWCHTVTAGTIWCQAGSSITRCSFMFLCGVVWCRMGSCGICGGVFEMWVTIP